ncbi:MAG: class I SAM-dependent methyltransferase [Planctomycetaceae bacterium]
MKPIAHTDRSWDEHYQQGTTPWDSQLRSAELARVLADHSLPRGRALELGCGSGTNAVYLAQQGFQVTAVDCSPTALEAAREKSAVAGVEIESVLADVQDFGQGRSPYDFLFDRGCYHCCRRVDLSAYLRTHQQVTTSGSYALVLSGNANDSAAGGPPKLKASEITAEFEPLYRVLQLREFRFEDAGGVPGPLGWSCLMRRR